MRRPGADGAAAAPAIGVAEAARRSGPETSRPRTAARPSVRTLLGLAGRSPAPRTMLAYDASLAWAALLLLAIGLVMVYSASIAMAESSAQTAHRSWYFLARHGAFVAIGLAAAVFAFQVPVKAWQALAPWLFVAGIALLVLVLVPGSAAA